jgi:hypothetical protein
MCDECQAIAEDFREATAELRLTEDRNRPEALLVVEALRRGTPEDAARVEEFFSSSAYARGAHLAWSRFMRAMGRQFAHEKRTGHHRTWRPWIPPH